MLLFYVNIHIFRFYNLFFSIWDCIEGIKSHLCEVAIPVMLHCVSLPCGSDIFWKLIRDEFHSSDWRTRFNAGKI